MAMTENEFYRQVVDLANALGWRVYHVEQSARKVTRRDGRSQWVRNVNNTGKGYPDLTLVRRKDARLIFAELKRDVGPRGGKGSVMTTPEQQEWLADLSAVRDRTALFAVTAAVEVYVWRPADIEFIERVLR